jgi:hypothetical protein
MGSGSTSDPNQLRALVSEHASLYVVRTFESGYKPGVDPEKLTELADELELDEMMRKLGSR